MPWADFGAKIDPSRAQKWPPGGLNIDVLVVKWVTFLPFVLRSLLPSMWDPTWSAWRQNCWKFPVTPVLDSRSSPTLRMSRNTIKYNEFQCSFKVDLYTRATKKKRTTKRNHDRKDEFRGKRCQLFHHFATLFGAKIDPRRPNLASKGIPKSDVDKK